MTNKYIEINGRKIGADFPPYIIAELSAKMFGDIVSVEEQEKN